MDAPADDVQRWGHAAVRAWLAALGLAALGLAAYAPLFAQHDITGQVLCDVTRPALRAMGVARVGDALRLAAAIAKLRAGAPPTPPHASPCSDARTGALRPPAPQPQPQPQWDDTIEVLAPDMVWMPPQPSMPPSRSRSGSAPISHSPGTHDPVSLSVGAASLFGRARAPSTPVSSAPGSPASGSLDAPVVHDLGEPRLPVSNSPPSALGGFSGFASRRIGARPPPLHLQQTTMPPPALPLPARAPLDPNLRVQARRHRHVHTDSSASSGGSASGSSLIPPLRSTSQPVETRVRSQSLFRVAAPTVQGLGSVHPTLRSDVSATGGTPTSGIVITQRHPSSSRPDSASGPQSLCPATQQLPSGHSPPLASAQLHWHQPPPQAQHQQPAGYGSTPPAGPSAGTVDVPCTPTSAQDSAFAPSLEGERPPSSSGFRTHWRNPPSSSSSQNPTLEDLQRRTMKFVSSDGASRMVNVSDCRDAAEVLARVLRKFGVPAQGNWYAAAPSPLEDERTQLWRLAAPMPYGETRLLEADELLTLCQSAPVTDRARGLLLVCLAPSSGLAGSVETLALPDVQDDILGSFTNRSPQTELSDAELCPAPSPLQPQGQVVPALPSPSVHGNASDTDGNEYDLDAPLVRADASRRPRGMSKLEAFFGERTETLAFSIQAPAKLKPRRKKTLNFFDLTPPQVLQVGSSPNPTLPAAPRRKHHLIGQRPPSELISSHLADFFPATEKRLLERTARRSLYHSSLVRRQSVAGDSETAKHQAPSLPPTPPSDNRAQYLLHPTQVDIAPIPVVEPSAEPRSEPGTSELDSELLTTPVPIPGPPPDAEPLGLAPGPASGPAPPVWRSDSDPLAHQLPPLILSSTLLPFQSSPLQGGAGQGNSGTHARAQRAPSYRSTHSDAASLLTVDEIGMEVEQRQSQDGEDRVSIRTATRKSVDRRSLRARSIRSGRSARSSRSSRSWRTTKRSLALAHEVQAAEAKSEAWVHEKKEEERKEGNTLGDCGRKSSGTLNATEEERENDKALVWGSDTEADADADEEDEEGDESALDVSDDSGDAGTGRIRWLQGALIGAGSFGNVFLGMNARTGVIMAVKQVELPPGYVQACDATDLNAQEQGQVTGAHGRKVGQLRALEREIELLKALKHPHIVQYLDSYADATHLNIFLEYVPGGSVAALVSEYGAFSERLARRFIRQILGGLRFLHSRNIVHRDIKGANILVDTASTIKISDFGISKKVESVVSGVSDGPKANRASLQGSVYWMAPEVVKQTAYTAKADIWSLGCLLVEMLTGTHPWATLNQMQALFKIGSGAGHPDVPTHASAQAANFLQLAFEQDYRARPTAATLLTHPFVAGSGTAYAADAAASASAYVPAPHPAPLLTSATAGQAAAPAPLGPH